MSTAPPQRADRHADEQAGPSAPEAQHDGEPTLAMTRAQYPCDI